MWGVQDLMGAGSDSIEGPPYRLKIPSRALVPFAGYRVYLGLFVEFFGRYNGDVEIRKIDVFENTVGYLLVGVVLVLLEREFSGYGYAPLEFIMIFYALTAAFEVDFMIWLHWKRLHWHFYEKVPREIAKTSGRRLTALGMYHGAIFTLAGFLATSTIFLI